MSRIKNETLEKMFRIAGLEKKKLHEALIEMGPKFLHSKKAKQEYDVNNPTRNFCYVVSEFIFYYIAPKGSKAYALNIEGDESLHRFIKWPDETIIDLTCDQFSDYSVVIYENAKVRPFLPVNGKAQPSKRARHLAKLLGYE